MMFEVEDLSQASPATVSRCGMVFLETKQLGWDPLVRSFVQSMPPSLEKLSESLEKILNYIIDLTLSYAMRHGKFFVHRSEMTLVGSCLKYLSTYMKEYNEESAKIPKDFEEIFSNIVIFCVVWSIGGALEESSRKNFQNFIADLIEGKPDLIEKYDLV